MYNIFSLAAYIINYAIEIEKPISNLSLQKILYYVQGAFFKTFDEPAFSEEIYAWKYGPVIPEIYHEYKMYSSSNINRKVENRTVFDFESEDYFSVESLNLDLIFTDEHANEVIQNIVESKTNHSPLTLVRETHEETPWSETDGQEVIQKELIYKYFNENPERLWT